MKARTADENSHVSSVFFFFIFTPTLSNENHRRDVDAVNAPVVLNVQFNPKAILSGAPITDFSECLLIEYILLTYCVRIYKQAVMHVVS